MSRHLDRVDWANTRQVVRTAKVTPGSDPILPPWVSQPFESTLEPWQDLKATWLAAIRAEGHVDVEVYTFRSFHRWSLTKDGQFQREGMPRMMDMTPRALRQAVALLAGDDLKVGALVDTLRWANPSERAALWAHLVARSPRPEDRDHPVLLRTFTPAPAVGPRHNQTLRAVLSGLHSAPHFDDAAVLSRLDTVVGANSVGRVSRGTDETYGHVTWTGADNNGASAAVAWVNSETGAASLEFRGSAHIRALDAIIGGRAYTVELADAGDATRRRHTLPRQGQSEDSRAREAARRMDADITKAMAASEALCKAWGRALESYPRGHAMGLVRPEDHKVAAAVLLDLMEEDGLALGSDRAPLEAVMTSERLATLPWGSIAYLAGCWALVGDDATNWEEARRCQAIAGQWVLGIPFAKR